MPTDYQPSDCKEDQCQVVTHFNITPTVKICLSSDATIVPLYEICCTFSRAILEKEEESKLTSMAHFIISVFVGI
jgi:hypothetical protein